MPILLMLALGGCAAPGQSRLAPVGAINWVVGEYHCGVPDSPFGDLHITTERRFILSRRDEAGTTNLIMGRVRTEPGSAATPVRSLELLPDTRFVGIPVPQRLYVMPGDSYQVLATHPFSPHQHRRQQLPSDYIYFNDGTALTTPTRFRDVLSAYNRNG
jgi:hypothetical protein